MSGNKASLLFNLLNTSAVNLLFALADDAVRFLMNVRFELTEIVVKFFHGSLIVIECSH